MSVPPLPPPLDALGQRKFSFYPAILNIEHNEWIFRKTSWSEILVFNPAGNFELWVPRRYLGEVSRIDEPVVIVGLSKELEFKGGMLMAHERRVLEMPRAVNEGPRIRTEEEQAAESQPAPVVGIRLESGAESRIARLIGGAIAVALVASVAVVILVRDGSRIQYSAVVQSDLPFNANDDVFSIEEKFGKPVEDKWRSDQGELQYRKLWYPDRGLNIILMGSDRKSIHYLGAFDKDWRVVHSVDLPGQKNSASMLRAVPRF
ncbi:MAG: hypothetical protein ABI823_14730 [Bryobacteraceae bacterium]